MRGVSAAHSHFNNLSKVRSTLKHNLLYDLFSLHYHLQTKHHVVQNKTSNPFADG